MLDRRSILGSMAALAVGSGQAGAEPDAPPSPLESKLPRTPQEHLTAIVRLVASLDEIDVPWWYRGIVYAQQENKAPQPIFKMEGVETYWFRHGGDGTYWVSSRTLSFLRDVKTDKMLYEFENPFTGEVNAVTPNTFGGDDVEHYTVDGITSPVVSSVPKTGPLTFDWKTVGPHVFLLKDRGSPNMPQPFLEAQSPSAPLRAFLDPAIRSLPSYFSSTWISPYPEWMNMGEIPGHTIWHSTGGKLKSIDELPVEYLNRARAEYPESLSAQPG